MMISCRYLQPTALASWMEALTWHTHGTLAGRCESPPLPLHQCCVITQWRGCCRQERLQALLREKHYGELPVGQAVVIPAYPPDERLDKLALSSTKNQGQPIRFLVSAPTMRIPCDVHKTVNAYLAFRAVLIAGIYKLCHCYNYSPWFSIKFLSLITPR